MKKVLFILAFLAIGMIATAQTQTIYNQLKLATVNDGTVSDSLVLVQGTDKIIRKIPLSSISGSTEIPSLQEVTNNGNVTSHPIHAKEFRVDSNADSLMVLNNRYFSIGDLGDEYGGNWNKYFSVFNPEVSDGLEFYLQGANDSDYQQFVVVPSLISMSWGQGNSTDYINNTFQLRDTGTVLRAVSTVSGDQSTNTLNVTSEYVEIFTSKPSEAKSMKLYLNEDQPNSSTYSLDLPPVGGELVVQQRDFGDFGNYSIGTDYYSGLRKFNFSTKGNAVEGLTGQYSFLMTPEDGVVFNAQDGSLATSFSIYAGGLSMNNYTDTGSSSHTLEADKFSFNFYSVSDGNDIYNFVPASKTSSGETNTYYMPTVSSGNLAIVVDSAPASATADGVVGEIRVTDTYVYVCVAENTWRRAALATW